MANLKDTNIFGLLKAMGEGSTLYPVDLIVEINSGYVRYNSGLQICYGVETWSGGNNLTVVYDKPFIEIPITLRTNISDSTNTGFKMSGVSIQTRSNTSFTMYCPDISGSAIQWLAIGRWK